MKRFGRGNLASSENQEEVHLLISDLYPGPPRWPSWDGEQACHRQRPQHLFPAESWCRGKELHLFVSKRAAERRRPICINVPPITLERPRSMKLLVVRPRGGGRQRFLT